MFFALRDKDFEKERNEILLKWLVAQENWKLSLLKLVKEEVEKNGIKDKLMD